MSINGFNIPVFDFLIDEIVAKTNLKNPYVYYLIQDDANMLSILFVSNYKEDWESESLSIVEDIVYPYVLNFSEPNCSEIGAIKVNNIDGCLVRIS